MTAFDADLTGYKKVIQEFNFLCKFVFQTVSAETNFKLTKVPLT